MKKKTLVISLLVAFGIIVIASAQGRRTLPLPPSPPPPPEAGLPPPHPPMGGPDVGFQYRLDLWEKFKKEHPEDAKILMDMMKKYPELKMIIGVPGMGPRAGGGMRGGARGWEMGDRMRMRDPAHHEIMMKIMSLRERAFELGEQYQNTTNTQEKKKIEGELRNVLAEIYDLRLAEMKMRVKHVETRLAQVKEELTKYEKDKNGVIESWFKQLTGQENYKEF